MKNPKSFNLAILETKPKIISNRRRTCGHSKRQEILSIPRVSCGHPRGGKILSIFRVSSGKYY